ncbi:hypothetical protein AAFF_G00020470 [Aldrovandia affinis]|uniref:Uncharacterized protein n=1 Tax=Aldrovandia affinis TaxID=143900 RepID=A0AAD7WGW5_9TELE|nr:hypothetical protein AAFF_G00020470 [Aldrovandia affinis]
MERDKMRVICLRSPRVRAHRPSLRNKIIPQAGNDLHPPRRNSPTCLMEMPFALLGELVPAFPPLPPGANSQSLPRAGLLARAGLVQLGFRTADTVGNL